MSARPLAKKVFHFISLVLMLPAALACGFGRIRNAYSLLTHAVALLPGLVGVYLRGAFYRMTLKECAPNVHIGFGTIFAHPEASVGPFVSTGLYCVIGRASIGARTQIASLVQIPSGRRQHARDREGRLDGAQLGEFQQTIIGADCWIGASAIIMASVGNGTTVGAGAVVVRELPPGVVAVGNPARVLAKKEQS
jgi:virginiamycin A acetyltransferase